MKGIFISKFDWYNLLCDIDIVKRQTKDIVKLLSLERVEDFIEDFDEDSKDVNKLQVASELLRRAAELLDEPETNSGARRPESPGL